MERIQEDCIQTVAAGPCFTIRFSSDATRNALSSAMFDRLEAALSDAAARASRGEVIAVVMEAQGRAYCAGFDLAEAIEHEGRLAQFVERLGAVLRTIRALDAVVIAKVQGAALAGGCALVAACDIVCASTDATFGYPVHRIGVSPAVSLPTLMATCGAGGARMLSLSGELVKAPRAQELGLVHQLAADRSALDALVARLVDDLITKGPSALRSTKRWLNRIDGTDPAGALGSRASEATRASADLCGASESRALLASFWANRKP